MMITEFLKNPIFLIALTFLIFMISKAIQKRTGIILLNPILITITFMIMFLTLFDLDYEDYNDGGKYIEFWLKPAVVALGVPLYRQIETIKSKLLPLLLAELTGCVVGIISVVVVAAVFGATDEVILSLAPKAVTTPVAIEISQAIGGIPPLTAAVVVCTGLFGAITGFHIAKLCKIRNKEGIGLSIGNASHAIGTAAAIEKGESCGAFSSLGLTLNGLFTALLSPFILSILGYC